MNNFNAIIERTLVPIASRLNAQRHVGAVRDAFMLTFPLTLAASMVILVNNLIFAKEGMIAKLLFLPKLFPNLESAQQFLSPVANGTISLMSVFIAYLVANILATHFKADDLLAGLTSVACFIILYPAPFAVEEGGKMVMETTFLGAQGLFVAMLVGCLVGEFLPKLFKSKRLIITMPDMVPPAVARSFSALIPIVIVIMICSVVSATLTMVAPGGINELIYNSIQSPLRQVGNNLWGVLILAFMEQLLWVLGIHGPNTLGPVRMAIFTEPDLANLAHVNEFGLGDVPFPETFGLLNDNFAKMGGSGMTLALIIAIFLVSRRKDHREMAKLSLAPGIFNINEPVIFGLPIVLNPLLMIPFILSPLVSITIAHFSISILKIIPAPAIGVPWTTPGPLIPFLGTGGNLVALIVAIICLVTSVLIYIPFVIAGNKAVQLKK